MRSFLIVTIVSLALGTGGLSTIPQIQHSRDLLVAIFDDVASIARSFAGGPDDPKNPVVNTATLREDADHLDAAQRKAAQLATELQQLKDDADGHGR